MTSRRKFMRDFSSVATLAALGPVPAIAARLSSPKVLLPEMDLKTFSALVDSRFLLTKGAGAWQSLELIEVSGQAASFSLLFRGDPACPLLQETYPFEHARLGRFEMFIVPVGHLDCGYCYYEAVFNRQCHEGFYG